MKDLLDMKAQRFFPGLLLIPSLLLLLFTACKQEGLDGESIVTGTTAHHSNPIPHTTVYLKFGATELPSTDPADYDHNVQADANGVYTIANLTKGEYYLYGIGYDSSIHQAVTGGIAFEIGKNETKTVNVAITE